MDPTDYVHYRSTPHPPPPHYFYLKTKSEPAFENCSFSRLAFVLHRTMEKVKNLYNSEYKLSSESFSMYTKKYL
jgi:hypothetical protein